MTEKKTAVAKFTKQQLLQSKKYAHRQDALTVLLLNDKAYSIAEVERILKDFYEGGKA